MKKIRLALVWALIGTLGSTVFCAESQPFSMDVRSCGAAGDGTTLDTAAIQRAVDTCNEKGGGTVHFSAGRYLSGTILLKDNVTLHLDPQAV